MHNDAVVIAFARLPVAGKAKTRLAASVGPEAAAAWYKLCAEAVFHQVSRCSTADGVVYCSQTEDVEGLQQWLADNNTPMPVYPQQQIADLGARMVAAMTAAVRNKQPSYQQQQGSNNSNALQQADQLPAASTEAAGQQQQYQAAIVVGTDIPDITAAVLNMAVAALQQYDMVLGPAEDGGYYLIGFSTEALLRPQVQSCRVFDSVVWSTSTVLKRTVAAAAKAGLRVAPQDTLPMLQDIDTLEDLEAWLQQKSVINQPCVIDSRDQKLKDGERRRSVLLQHSSNILVSWRQGQLSCTEACSNGLNLHRSQQ